MERARRHQLTRRSPRRGETGAALVQVIWLAALLAIIAIGFMRHAQLSHLRAANVADMAQARALTDAGVRVAIARLVAAGAEPLDWPFVCRIDDGVLAMDVSEEAAKIDLNRASRALLSALFQAAGAEERAADEVAASVIDYRDADDLAENGDSETAIYGRAGLGYPPPNRNFSVIEELLYVPGVSAELFERVRDAITVNALSAGSLRSAPPALVAQAYEILGAREGRAALDRAQPETGEDPAPLILRDGHWLTIDVEARAPRGAQSRREALVLIDRSGARAPEIARWRIRESSRYDARARPEQFPSCY